MLSGLLGMPNPRYVLQYAQEHSIYDEPSGGLTTEESFKMRALNSRSSVHAMYQPSNKNYGPSINPKFKFS